LVVATACVIAGRVGKCGAAVQPPLLAPKARANAWATYLPGFAAMPPPHLAECLLSALRSADVAGLMTEDLAGAMLCVH
jgi:hypothetical protein